MLLYTNSTLPYSSGTSPLPFTPAGEEEEVNASSLNLETISQFAAAVVNGRSAVPVSLWGHDGHLKPLASIAPLPDRTLLKDALYVDGDWDLFRTLVFHI